MSKNVVTNIKYIKKNKYLIVIAIPTTKSACDVLKGSFYFNNALVYPVPIWKAQTPTKCIDWILSFLCNTHTIHSVCNTHTIHSVNIKVGCA